MRAFTAKSGLNHCNQQKGLAVFRQNRFAPNPPLRGKDCGSGRDDKTSNVPLTSQVFKRLVGPIQTRPRRCAGQDQLRRVRGVTCGDAIATNLPNELPITTGFVISSASQKSLTSSAQFESCH